MTAKTRAVLGIAIALVPAAGCQPGEEERYIDFADADLRLAVELPSRMRPGDTGDIRIVVENRSDETTGGFDVYLVVPAWLRLSDPELPEEVDGVRRGRHGVGLRLPVGDGDLAGGGDWVVDVPVERVEIPADPGSQIGAVVRAWLGDRAGAVYGPAVEVRVPGAPRPGQVRIEREGIGPARLGAETGLLRENVPSARDTTVLLDDEVREALVLPVGERASVLVVESGGVVTAVIVRDPRVRTRGGVGVGTTLERLLKVHGRGCLRADGDASIAWFPSLSGLEFGLEDAGAPPADPAPIDPAALSGSAVVGEIRIRRDDPACPPMPDPTAPE